MKSNGKFALLKCMKMYEVIKTSLHRMHLIEIVNVNSLFCLSCHFFFCCWFCYLSHFSSIEHVRNTFFSLSQNKNEKYITLIMFVSIHLMLCMFCKWTQYEPYSSNARNAIESSLLARAHTHSAFKRNISNIFVQCFNGRKINLIMGFPVIRAIWWQTGRAAKWIVVDELSWRVELNRIELSEDDEQRIVLFSSESYMPGPLFPPYFSVHSYIPLH